MQRRCHGRIRQLSSSAKYLAELTLSERLTHDIRTAKLETFDVFTVTTVTIIVFFDVNTLKMEVSGSSETRIPLYQTRSAPSSRATFCPQRRFKCGNVTLSLMKPRRKAEVISETYELLLVDTYITLLIHFVKMC
jgi:hypothetical protein